MIPIPTPMNQTMTPSPNGQASPKEKTRSQPKTNNLLKFLSPKPRKKIPKNWSLSHSILMTSQPCQDYANLALLVLKPPNTSMNKSLLNWLRIKAKAKIHAQKKVKLSRSNKPSQSVNHKKLKNNKKIWLSRTTTSKNLSIWLPSVNSMWSISSTTIEKISISRKTWCLYWFQNDSKTRANRAKYRSRSFWEESKFVKMDKFLKKFWCFTRTWASQWDWQKLEQFTEG